MGASLADILMRAGKLDAPGLERAQALGLSTGERVDVVLTRLGVVAEEDMARALAEHLDLPLARTEHYPDAPLLADKATTRFLKQARVLPLEDRSDSLALAMADPLDRYALDAMGLLIGKRIEPWVAVPAEFAAAFDRLYGARGPLAEIAPGFPSGAATVDRAGEPFAEDERRLRDRASDAPVVRLVDALIEDAATRRASDIHLEPLVDRLRVRFRIDGVLQDVTPPSGQLQQAIVSRVKVMANLNIAERRLAQDGRIRASVRGREIDIRVSTVPVQHGESVVLRLLDKSQGPLDFDGLGFAPDIDTTLKSLLGLANGIVLVTGPTGSGKSTTLYAGLRLLNSPEVKILTAEDPVEYELPGVNQIQIRPQIGLGFPTILRSMLRQDPDVMMVGEIRDRETAQIAVQAALTGHLVLSTLHTNDALGAVARLIDMGIEDYLLTAALKGIVAQRLVRTLCPLCRASYRAEAGLAAVFGEAVLHRAVGCPACNGVGYVGRTVIAEAVTFDAGLRELVLQRADAHRLAEYARQAGLRSLRDDGLRKVRAGVTSYEEVLRVTQTL